jgi:predicted lipoprotein with Yx(FWY)xxD motif
MSPLRRRPAAGLRRARLAVLAAVTGLALVATAAVVAKTFTLHVAKHAAVTNQSSKTVHENIVVNSGSMAVYVLSGDSKAHPKCTLSGGCFAFWPPVKVASKSSLSKGPGVPGRLGIWRRNGFNQVTLNGHPLYTYVGDTAKNQANGQGVMSFGGTWSVVKVKTTTSGSGSTGSGW